MADRNRRALIIAVTSVAFAAAGVTLAASAGVIRAAQGPVRATLGFEKAQYEYRRLELTIVRPRTRFSQRLGRTYFERPKLYVRDLDADREPEVWVDTYTGGAHCCDVTRIFRYVPGQVGYVGIVHSWGDVGYRAKNLDGRGDVELVSSDDRFAYVFTDFADSSFPLQLWHFDRGRLIDVTRRFPGQVELDANDLQRSYRRLQERGWDVRGVLAAWMADEYLLGREQSGWALLGAAFRRGELGPKPELRGWPQGRAYLRTLKAYLRKLGYAPV